jgi:hypothetical protein
MNYERRSADCSGFSRRSQHFWLVLSLIPPKAASAQKHVPKPQATMHATLRDCDTAVSAIRMIGKPSVQASPSLVSIVWRRE